MGYDPYDDEYDDHYDVYGDDYSDSELDSESDRHQYRQSRATVWRASESEQRGRREVQRPSRNEAPRRVTIPPQNKAALAALPLLPHLFCLQEGPPTSYSDEDRSQHYMVFDILRSLCGSDPDTAKLLPADMSLVSPGIEASVIRDTILSPGLVPLWLPKHNSLLCFHCVEEALFLYCFDLLPPTQPTRGHASRTTTVGGHKGAAVSTEVRDPRRVLRLDPSTITLPFCEQLVLLRDKWEPVTFSTKAGMALPETRAVPSGYMIHDWLLGTMDPSLVKDVTADHPVTWHPLDPRSMYPPSQIKWASAAYLAVSKLIRLQIQLGGHTGSVGEALHQAVLLRLRCHLLRQALPVMAEDEKRLCSTQASLLALQTPYILREIVASTKKLEGVPGVSGCVAQFVADTVTTAKSVYLAYNSTAMARWAKYTDGCCVPSHVPEDSSVFLPPRLMAGACMHPLSEVGKYVTAASAVFGQVNRRTKDPSPPRPEGTSGMQASARLHMVFQLLSQLSSRDLNNRILSEKATVEMISKLAKLGGQDKYDWDFSTRQSRVVLMQFGVLREAHRIAVAFDKHSGHNLLGSVSLPLDLSILEGLVLGSREEADLLHGIEQYFGGYSSQEGSVLGAGKNDLPALWSGKDPAIQEEIKGRWDKWEAEREEKLEELDTQRALYKDLMAQSREVRCICEEERQKAKASRLAMTYLRKVMQRRNLTEAEQAEYDEGYYVKKSCEHCPLVSRAKGLSVDRLEEPLPRTKHTQDAIVFYQCMPPVFAAFFEFYLHLVSVFCKEADTVDSDSRWCWERGNGCSGLSLGGCSKQISKSHYREGYIHQCPTNDTFFTPCARVGLEFYTTSKRYQLPLVGAEWELPHTMVTADTSDSRYKGTEEYVTGTGHTQNKVIADQRHCTQLPLSEYIQFGTVRSCGGYLQVRSLLAAVSGNTLRFQHDAVACLARSINQAGPCASGGVERDWRDYWLDPDNVSNAVECCVTFVDSLGENWDHHIALDTVIALARSMDIGGRREAMRLVMARVWKCASEWLLSLLRCHRDTLADTSRRHDVTGLEKAITRVSCYAIQCYRHVEATPSSVIQYLRAVTARRDHESDTRYHSGRYRSSDSGHHYEQEADYALAVLTPDILKQINETPSLLSQFLAVHCPGMAPDSDAVWDAYEPKDDEAPACVFWCRSALGVLSVDVLRGTVLLNGRTLSSLPYQITESDAFVTLFGGTSGQGKRLAVAYSEQERAYVTVKPVGDFIYSFHTANDVRGRDWYHQCGYLRRDSSVYITRVGGDGTRWLYVPSGNLNHELPDFMQTQFRHWYTGPEFNPVVDLWSDAPTRRLAFNPIHSKELECIAAPSKFSALSEVVEQGWIITRDDGQRVICPGEPVAEAMHEVVSCLDDVKHVLLTVEKEGGDAIISLVRLNVQFRVDANTCCVTSVEYPDLHIPSSPVPLGTLLGLESMLVLVDGTGAPKRVLVPHGQLQTCSASHSRSEPAALHHSVHIPVSADSRYDSPSSLFVYAVRSDLKCLESTSVEGDLYLAWLHAVTASTLPDPLTGCPGAEMAMVHLRRGWTNVPYTAPMHRVLEGIVQAASGKEFFPPGKNLYLKVQNGVLGASRGFDDALILLVEALFRQSTQLEALHPAVDQTQKTRHNKPGQILPDLALALRKADVLRRQVAGTLPLTMHLSAHELELIGGWGQISTLIQPGDTHPGAAAAVALSHSFWTHTLPPGGISSMFRARHPKHPDTELRVPIMSISRTALLEGEAAAGSSGSSSHYSSFYYSSRRPAKLSGDMFAAQVLLALSQCLKENPLRDGSDLSRYHLALSQVCFKLHDVSGISVVCGMLLGGLAPLQGPSTTSPLPRLPDWYKDTFDCPTVTLQLPGVNDSSGCISRARVYGFEVSRELSSLSKKNRFYYRSEITPEEKLMNELVAQRKSVIDTVCRKASDELESLCKALIPYVKSSDMYWIQHPSTVFAEFNANPGAAPHELLPSIIGDAIKRIAAAQFSQDCVGSHYSETPTSIGLPPEKARELDKAFKEALESVGPQFKAGVARMVATCRDRIDNGTFKAVLHHEVLRQFIQQSVALASSFARSTGVTQTVAKPWYPSTPLRIPTLSLSPGELTLSATLTTLVQNTCDTAVFSDFDAVFDQCIRPATSSAEHTPKPFPLPTDDPLVSQPVGQALMASLKASWEKAQEPDTDTWTLIDRSDARRLLEGLCAETTIRREALWNAVHTNMTAWLGIPTPDGKGDSPWSVFGGVHPAQAAAYLLTRMTKNEPLRRLLSVFYTACTYEQKAHACLRELDSLGDQCDTHTLRRSASRIRIRHTGEWSPLAHPETLLFEAERQIIVRPEQHATVEVMLSHAEAGKVGDIFQMANGFGKSSVLTPLLCARLARQGTMPRVTVLSSLFDNNSASLRHWLGGLLGMRLLAFPCHRTTPMTSDLADTMLSQLKAGRESGAVLLTVPEHWLSLLLKSRETDISGDATLAPKLCAVTEYMDTHCLTVLDESDELLSPRFELVYSMGKQGHVDGDIRRWTAIGDVLFAVNLAGQELQIKYPGTFTHVAGEGSKVAGGWRGLRVTAKHEEAQDELEQRVLQIVLEQPLMRDVVGHYGSDTVEAFVSGADVAFASDHPSSPVLPTLLTLRGMLHHSILHSVLCKRWGVQYGLDLSRRMMAVPYRAKDTPSDRADYSHPDVALALTYLSYFYTGLNLPQFREVLGYVLAGDAKAARWRRIIAHADSHTGDVCVPESMRAVECINLKDSALISSLHRALRYNMQAIRYYLVHHAFKRESKQFPSRLQSSSWDMAATQCIGFSGTNDSAVILPAGVRQRELDPLVHTNGTILSYLTHRDNKYAALKVPEVGREILRQTVELGCTVLIDAGAQMIDLDNDDVAREWLALSDASAEAVVYFSEESNGLTVLTRQGVQMRLKSSPYALNLSRCLCYYDDFHSRGTDLPGLPKSGIRAVLTLGPSLKKEKLVQSAMRLRQLSRGQSVTYLAPPEVHAELGDLSGGTGITPTHVVMWSIHNTVRHLHQSMVLWAGQAISYGHNTAVQVVARSTPSAKTEWLVRETSSLASLYLPSRTTMSGSVHVANRVSAARAYITHALPASAASLFGEVTDEVVQRSATYLADVHVYAAAFDDEQERELEREQEQEEEREREVQPLTLRPHIPTRLSSSLKLFAYGRDAEGMLDLSAALAHTSLSLSAPQFEDRLFCTPYFTEVVLMGLVSHCQLDSFARPPMYALTSKHGVLVVSPWEASRLIKKGHLKTGHCRLVMLHPRPSRDHRFYVSEGHLPRAQGITWQIESLAVAAQLSLFAGSVYCASDAELNHWREFLASCLSSGDGPAFARKLVFLRDTGVSLEHSDLQSILLRAEWDT
ncbi:protein of unknown function DUF3645 [Kipferlia bialata]|uniref:ubiquitinyl hydrolase 1 n=1 Tax=Kipferlia bialata TaxID=797122 RepID=A0A391NLV1_9EUKA|nr:protein of unknown function DUF3645 [Kipferlia bialata]|eukprot:g1416.t1